MSEKFPFSNFQKCDVVYEGVHYPTVEHAYQAAKAASILDREKIWNAPTAGAAKRIGRTIQVRAGWEDMKIGVMYHLLKQKFSKEPFKTQLMGYVREWGDDNIIEWNLWHDNYWGICYCPKCTGGENNLGRLLMRIKREMSK